MISMETQGLGAVIAQLKKQSAALKDLTPAYKRFGAEIVKKTDDAFQASKGYDGEAWEPLAESTIAKRVGSLKAANKRTKSGKLTKGAEALRGKMLAPGGIKPLIDTARARNSSHTNADSTGVEWSAVGYLGVHMGGTDKAGRSRNVVIPIRNPSPFIWSGSDWKLRESARQSLAKLIRQHVFGGAS